MSNAQTLVRITFSTGHGDVTYTENEWINESNIEQFKELTKREDVVKWEALSNEGFDIEKHFEQKQEEVDVKFTYKSKEKQGFGGRWLLCYEVERLGQKVSVHEFKEDVEKLKKFLKAPQSETLFEDIYKCFGDKAPQCIIDRIKRELTATATTTL